MVMTRNVPVYTVSSYSPTVGLSVQTIIFNAGITIPGDFKLRHPLVAELEVTRDGFVIHSPWLDEEAFGTTERAVLLDFLTSLRDRYNSLSRRAERLSKEDRSVLERLRALLIQNEV